eukprot:scaffold305951_cov31-Tisochrysis_lutea.AAC.2
MGVRSSIGINLHPGQPGSVPQTASGAMASRQRLHLLWRYSMQAPQRAYPRHGMSLVDRRWQLARQALVPRV